MYLLNQVTINSIFVVNCCFFIIILLFCIIVLHSFFLHNYYIIFGELLLFLNNYFKIHLLGGNKVIFFLLMYVVLHKEIRGQTVVSNLQLMRTMLQGVPNLPMLILPCLKESSLFSIVFGGPEWPDGQTWVCHLKDPHSVQASLGTFGSLSAGGK